MVWTSRLETASHKQIIIVFVVSAIWLIGSIILGMAGPSLLQRTSHSSWNCSDDNHTIYNHHTCNGVQLSSGKFSNLYELKVSPLNKHFYLVLRPYYNTVFQDDIKIKSTFYQGTQGSQWKIIENLTVTSFLDCPDVFGAQCQPFILAYEDSLNYNKYGMKIQMTDKNGFPLSGLDDVVFEYIVDNPQFSIMSIALHLLYLLITVALILFHLIPLIMSTNTEGKRLEWTTEQKMLIMLCIALLLYNNPMYSLEFLANGWFVRFLGHVFELVFTVILFSTWFFEINKLRSIDGKIQLSVWIVVEYGLIVIYTICGLVLYAWTSIRDLGSAIYGVSSHVTGLQAFYYLHSVSLFWVQVSYYFIIVFSIVSRQYGTDEFQKRKFAFFVVPSFIVSMAIMVSTANGNFGPLSRDSPSVVVFLAIFNLYTYILLWGYWPISLTIGSGHVVNEATITTTFVSDSSSLLQSQED